MTKPAKQIIIDMMIFFILSFTLQGQVLLNRYYSISDGLSSPTINDITQDSRGRMWFATLQGLTCYDGNEWKNYSVMDGLFSSRYIRVLASTEGSLWAFSWDLADGITYFDGKYWLHIEFPTPLSGMYSQSASPIPITSTALVENQQKIYIAIGTLDFGLYIYNTSDKRWTHLADEEKRLDGDILGLSADDFQKRFFVATSQDLFMVTPGKTIKCDLLPIEIPSSPVHTISVQQQVNRIAPDGSPAAPNIWLTGDNWVGYWDGKEFKKVYQGEKIFTPNLDELQHAIALPDGFGGLWVGGQGVLLNFRADGKYQKYQLYSSPQFEEPLSMFYDREANLWIGWPSGLGKITSFCFDNFNRLTGLYDNEVTAIMELGDGELIFGHNGGFTFYRDGQFSIYAIPGTERVVQNKARVLDMCRDSQGNTWATVSLIGVAKITPSHQVQWSRVKDMPAKATYTSIVAGKDNAIWLAINRNIYKIENNHFHRINTQEPLPNIRRLFSFKQRAHELYIASQQGLYVMNTLNNQVTRLAPGNKNVNPSIYALHLDKTGRFLVGGYEGLFTLDKGYLNSFKPGDLDVNVPVYFIVEDAHEQLWFGLHKGVIRWDGQTARHYHMYDGLLGNETNRAAGYTDKNGYLWIGTEQGVARYDKTRDRELPVAPLIELQGVEVGGIRYPLDQPYQFSPDLDDLTFHFNGISFIDEANISYKFKLVGYDNNWVDQHQSTQNHARYTNLPPGHYSFSVQSVNHLGVSSLVVSSSGITIKRPFVKSWVFYGLNILFAFCTIFLIFNFFSKKKYASQLYEEVKSRTKQVEHSEKEFRDIFNNAHDAIFIFTPENEIVLDVNPRACEIYGFTRQEFLGMSLESISKNIEHGKQKIKETEIYGHFLRFETTQFRKDGSEMQLEINASLIDYRGKKAILSINRDITERKYNELRLEKSLKEKDILLKEIHHRVKNNLQIISSIMDLQVDSFEDPSIIKIFQDSKNRIHSMALLHENLYQSGDLSQIDMSAYIRRLVDSFYSSYEHMMSSVFIEINAEEIFLDMDSAIPVGLILTELMTNALKHAFPNEQIGNITLTMKPDSPGYILLQVSDNGVGLPERLNIKDIQSLGLQLVSILSRQLRGTIEFIHEKGTSIKIIFPYEISREKTKDTIVRFHATRKNSTRTDENVTNENND